MRHSAAGILVASALGLAPAAALDADTVLTNGRIVTLEAAGTVEALAATDGRIVAAGGSPEIARLTGARTRTIDLAGRTVIPGPDRLAHARDPRGAVLSHRGELDRHEVDPRGDGAHPRGGIAGSAGPDPGRQGSNTLLNRNG